MARLQQTEGLSDEQGELLALVREFVDEQIIPVAMALEHADEYPTKIVEQMQEMGIFGLMIPEEYGGLGESLLTYALTVEELSPRLDVASAASSTRTSSSRTCSCSTAPRSRSSGTCRGWPPARSAARSR